ncbi:curli-like amyloid fiber formation chaperone CsgH [Phaeodactylibacter xiamenensis]|jgi:curli production assembly/transport component CsgE|uniref:curli-like amyloid fiber formation chaperone CsgH n=1 Tax=Phaeodactylibacter xiamenensis TaxID=1524460 RepID=UPI0024A7B6E1|nr:curli-like amyloid fiber formation chaperone CsgH [Phaeodactylibacter xiamenensis]
MNFRITALIVFLGLFFSTAAVAQTEETEDILATLKVTKTDGQLELSAHCTNNSGRDRSLSYQLTMLRIDTRQNRSSSKQGGSFELGHEGERRLSVTSVNIDDGSYVLATLDIYEGEDLLAQAREVVGEIPKKDTQPKAAPSPTPDIKKNGPQNGYGSAGQDIELGGGFIVDETRTRSGQEFYEAFYQSWQEPQTQLGYLIRIEEKPAPGRSTRINVILDGEEVFARMLPPKSELIRELAEAVANYINQKVVQQAQVEQALEGDQTGSGLY